MRELEDFLPFVLPHATACPEPTALKYLREAAITFCQRTRVWREVDTLPVDGLEIQTVCVPPHSSLFEIEGAWLDGERLSPAPFAKVAHLLDRRGQGKPQFITQTRHDAVMLLPRGPGKLRISMFLTPAHDAEVVPTFLYDQFGREIGWGALAEICLLPNQPFTSPDMALLFSQRFTSACDRNFAANIKGQQRAPARSKPSFF